MATIAISEIQLFDALKGKLGDKEAEELVSFVKVKVENEINEQSSRFSTREDILNLETKLAETKVDIIKWVVGIFFALAMMILGLYIKN